MNEKLEIDAINMMALKNEKLKWNRLHDKMDRFLDEIRPLEEQILELHNLRNPILDKIEILRKEMVYTCIHPKKLLIHNSDHILCKFCNTKLSIPKIKRTNDGRTKKI